MSGLADADASRFPVSRKSSRMAARPCGGRAVPRLENAVLDEQLDQLVDPPPVHEARVARHHLPDRLACRQLPELHVATSVPASPLYHLGFGYKRLGLFTPVYLVWIVDQH